jgi:diacylglycerol O-acyltransferase
MRAAKEQHGALPADLLADVTQFAMPALAGQAARLSARLRLLERINLFNLIISNVPGPNVPLYYAGNRLLGYYPLSAITDGQGLNITVMSYGGQLHLGLIADRDLVPDLDAMAGYIADELDVLTAAVVPAVEIDVTDHAAARRRTKKPVRPTAS